MLKVTLKLTHLARVRTGTCTQAVWHQDLASFHRAVVTTLSQWCCSQSPGGATFPENPGGILCLLWESWKGKLPEESWKFTGDPGLGAGGEAEEMVSWSSKMKAGSWGLSLLR